MNIKKFIVPVAALLMAGCATCPFCGSDDDVIGNWSGKLDYDDMSATSLIFSRGDKGEVRAYVLYRWASPEWCREVKVEGGKFSFIHPYGHFYEGEVDGDAMTGTVTRYDKGKCVGKAVRFTASRNKPTCPKATSKGVKLGEGIDLLASGLDGWQTMNPKATFGWSMKTENGERILSNYLGLNEKGKWKGGGANLVSKRADFKDFNLEYDVRVPAKSNSGVYLRGRFEIQVVDSYGKPVDRHNMAAYYGRVTPKVAAEKKPGEWQHVNVTLANRHLTVILNGVTIIDDAEITGVTGGAIDADIDAAGPIYLQGDHSDADFKNMILKPVVD